MRMSAAPLLVDMHVVQMVQRGVGVTIIQASPCSVVGIEWRCLLEEGSTWRTECTEVHGHSGAERDLKYLWADCMRRAQQTLRPFVRPAQE